MLNAILTQLGEFSGNNFLFRNIRIQPLPTGKDYFIESTKPFVCLLTDKIKDELYLVSDNL